MNPFVQTMVVGVVSVIFALVVVYIAGRILPKDVTSRTSMAMLGFIMAVVSFVILMAM
jgi:hypothetical protein